MGQENNTIVQGKATVLAIGTAVPPNFINQSDYPDYYFKVTKSEHLKELKQKFTRICSGTQIQKRHFYLTDEMLKDHPNLTTVTQNEEPLDSKDNFLAPWVTKLAKEAAEQALREWGQPRSRITHLIFHTATGCFHLPGPDYQLAKLLGLEPTVNRYMLFLHGCYGGGAVLRLAKDLAENNPDARVLAICSESILSLFSHPSETSRDALVPQALFGDGAAAVIIGSNPDMSVEQPFYEILSVGQSLIPGSEDSVGGRITKSGLIMYLEPTVPMYVNKNIQKSLSKTFEPLGLSDWNSLFWIVHPGGPKILDGIETELKLEKDKLFASRHVLTEHGNMMSGSVFFVMDEMRKRSRKEGKATTGKGAEIGVLLGFGPGITIETAVLRAFPVPN